MIEREPCEKPDPEGDEDSVRQRRIAALAPYRWRPGQSGNPHGSSRALRGMSVLAKARALARESAIEAVAELVAIMRASRDERMRAWCAREVLKVAQDVPGQVERWGRPGEHPSALAPAQNAADLDALFEKLGREALYALARSGEAARTVEVELVPRGEAQVDSGAQPAQTSDAGGEGVRQTGTPALEGRGRRPPEKEAASPDGKSCYHDGSEEEP